MALELCTATIRGFIDDGVLWRGLGHLDEIDLRAWLTYHGASRDAVERSPILQGLYDLTFAYREGDKDRPDLAAGKGIQALVLMAHYHGAFMWRMKAGMGDVVFAPLYLALRARGVRFEFFTRVTGLELAPGIPLVERIVIRRQATVMGGTDAYDPLIDVGGRSCWPSEPRWEQLSDERASRIDLEQDTRRGRQQTLGRGTHFDEVVLAIPVGALPPICGELADARPRFRRMLDGAHTVRTKALQLWLTRPPAELSSHAERDGSQLDSPSTAFARPFDTYCDMTHLLAAEGYGGVGPDGVAYFCAAFPDGPMRPRDIEREVRAEVTEFLDEKLGSIWPGAVSAGTFDWNLLFDPADRPGRRRLEAQYLRVNATGTERYVTTPAGSVDSRLHPGESGFENLVLAGDWTHNDIDGGCVEAAVISGERAGAALNSRSRAAPRHPGRITPRRFRADRDGTALPKFEGSGGTYIEYGGFASSPGPLVCEGARLYCFFLRADRARLQQLCDRVLKKPTGGALRYVPRLDHVVLTFGVLSALRSLHPGFADRGFALEREAAIWIPTIAQQAVGHSYTSRHLALFMPYVWVDNPIALVSGREVYGFAKNQGWPSDTNSSTAPTPGLPDPPAELHLDVFGGDYSSRSQLDRVRLLTVERAASRGKEASRARPRRAAEPSPPSPAPEHGTDLVGLVEHFLPRLAQSTGPMASPRRLRDVPATVATVLGELRRRQLNLVFLKQFRDAKSGHNAVLTQLVEARASVEGKLRWRALTFDHKLTVSELESHPLGLELGLELEQNIPHAFTAEFDFRMEAGHVVWPSS